MSPLLLVLAALTSPMQTSQDAPMELSFSRVVVKPGESAALPIYLVSEKTYTEPFQITLEFTAGELTFQKIETAYLAKKAKWSVSAAAAAHPDKSDKRVLKIAITPGQSSFFPSGAVAHAHFLVNKNRREGDILLEAALLAPPSAPRVASAEPAKITVRSTPVFGCFFYMH